MGSHETSTSHAIDCLFTTNSTSSSQGALATGNYFFRVRFELDLVIQRRGLAFPLTLEVSRIQPGLLCQFGMDLWLQRPYLKIQDVHEFTIEI